VNRLFLSLSAGIVLLAPFREGGRDPIALVVLHTLALLCILLVSLERVSLGAPALPSPPARWAALFLAAFLLLSLVSASRALYPLAAALGEWDLCIACGLFMAACCGPAKDEATGTLRDLAIASTTLQALVAFGRAWVGGTAAAGASFLNPNHLAAFLNLGLLLVVAAAEESLRRRERRVFLLWGGLGALHFAALSLLASRGAFLGLATALVVLGAVRWRSWSRRGRAACAALAILVLAAGGAVILLRFARVEDPYSYHRPRIWRASLAMVWEHPLLGYGAGMFRHEAANHNFPLDDGPIRFGRVFQGAHSGLLTLAAENGVPAAVCLLTAGLAVLVSLFRRHPGPDAVALGIGLALTALMAQGLVEDLQERPALTLVPALLIGTALRGSRRPQEERTPVIGQVAPATAPPARPARAVKVVLVVAASYLFCLAIARPFLAHRSAETARRMGRQGLVRMERAARLNPLHPEYRHDLAMAQLNSPPLTPERYAEAALRLYEARRLKPIDYRFPLLLGRLEARAGPSLFSDPSAADRTAAFYREAAQLAPLDPRPRLELAGHLAGLGRLEEGLEEVKATLRVEPHFLRAGILKASILLRLGRKEESRGALRDLERTLAILNSYQPDSTYARELVADAPEERRRLRQFVDKGGTGDYIGLSQLLH
jgi:O-antigen ligase